MRLINYPISLYRRTLFRENLVHYLRHATSSYCLSSRISRFAYRREFGARNASHYRPDEARSHATTTGTAVASADADALTGTRRPSHSDAWRSSSANAAGARNLSAGRSETAASDLINLIIIERPGRHRGEREGTVSPAPRGYVLQHVNS